MAREERGAAEGGVAFTRVPVSAAMCTGTVHYLGKMRPCRGRPVPGNSRCHKHLTPTLAKVNADDLYFLLYHALCGIEYLELARSPGAKNLDRIHGLIDAYASYLPPERLPSLAPENVHVTQAELESEDEIHDPLTSFLDAARSRE